MDGCLPFPLSDGMHQSIQQQKMQEAFGIFSNMPVVATPSMDLSYSLATVMEKQRLEIDQFLLLQSERLRAALHQRRTQTASSLLASLYSKASTLLRSKDKELAKLRNRYMELEELLRRTKKERDLWERLAKKEEAIAKTLKNTLEQVREPCFFSTGEGEDDGPASCSGFTVKGTPAESTADKGQVLLPCKSCGCRDSCVLLIPCQHLCTCEPCASFLDACPLCGLPKKDGLPVLLNCEHRKKHSGRD